MTLRIALPLLALATPAQEDAPAPTVVAAETRAHVETVELEGTFAPLDGEELALWLQEFSGELIFLDVQPHGSFVNAGDVVARLDPTKIDRQLRDAELDLQSAAIRHAGTAERAQVDAAAAQRKRAEAESGLDRARRALEGWQAHELELVQRGDELGAQYRQHSIDDQEDELRQLEAMYRDDELVDATEEIVLQRSRRNLARSRAGQKIEQDKLAYEREYERALRGEQRREAVASQEAALERLVRTQEIDARKRDDDVRRSSLALDDQRAALGRLQADRERFELRAPRAGVLLHGGLDDYRAGANRPDHERGARASQRQELFTVADADPRAVSVLVKESQLGVVRAGQAVTVSGKTGAEARWIGTLELEAFPTHASGSKPEAEFLGRVLLERPAAGVAAGMRAAVEITGEPQPDAVVLPRAAVHGSGDEAHCWVAGPAGEFARRGVRLGSSAGGGGGEVVVTGGLRAGERVLAGAPSGAGASASEAGAGGAR